MAPVGYPRLSGRRAVGPGSATSGELSARGPQRERAKPGVALVAGRNQPAAEAAVNEGRSH
jgi:hypothetical protein